ncbi:MAG TPA: slipin family protein [Thermoanaerobaculia bacterium]|jgi:regulator of protease activity HflC (stomatin/prohibitin superfamily)
MAPFGLFVIVLIAVILLSRWINILQEYERAVTFFLGRVSQQARGPGLVFIFWPMERMVRVSTRTIAFEVQPQDVITRDNVSVRVNAVLYYRVVDPIKAIISVENYPYATNQLAQTTLRSVLGQADLDELLSERDKLNGRLQEIIDAHTDPWGIKVAMVEVKQVDLPQEMQRAMARQAEAEREKRAKIIHAEGELEASAKLGEAAVVIARNPVTLQLRYLQTLTEISAEKNSTILFPVPIEMFKTFMGKDS